MLIDFDNAVTEEGRKVSAGLHLSAFDNNLYISFLNESRDEDEDFFIPSGTLFYDVATKEYKIEDREKAAGNKLSGKVFSYNDETQLVRFEGPINLFSGSKDFNVKATAIGQGNMQNNDIRMNSMVIVNTTAVSAAFDAMATDIAAVVKNESVEEGLGDRTDLLYKIADIVGERVARVLGVSVVRVKLVTITISAFLAGLAGGVYAMKTLFLSPYDAFGLGRAVEALVIPIFGGLYTTAGPLLGGLIIVSLETWLRLRIGEGYLVVYGVILVLTILFLPKGLMSLLARRKGASHA